MKKSPLLLVLLWVFFGLCNAWGSEIPVTEIHNPSIPEGSPPTGLHRHLSLFPDHDLYWTPFCPGRQNEQRGLLPRQPQDAHLGGWIEPLRNRYQRHQHDGHSCQSLCYQLALFRGAHLLGIRIRPDRHLYGSTENRNRHLPFQYQSLDQMENFFEQDLNRRSLQLRDQNSILFGWISFSG